MHELSLLENVREALETEAKKQGFTQVKQVILEIGALSCVEEDALRFAFDVVMQQSLAESATLVINTIAGIGVCLHCQQQIALETLHDPCPYCGHFGVHVLQGQAMRIKELIVN